MQQPRRRTPVFARLAQAGRAETGVFCIRQTDLALGGQLRVVVDVAFASEDLQRALGFDLAEYRVVEHAQVARDLREAVQTAQTGQGRGILRGEVRGELPVAAQTRPIDAGVAPEAPAGSADRAGQR